MKKRRKLFETKRKGFRLLLDPDIYEDVMMRSRQRAVSMTAYITKAILDRILYEKKYE